MTLPKKARAPAWWGRLTELIPQFSIPFLEPKKWDTELAKKWVTRIPSKCPFERQLWWGDRLILYVPPLCSLNPFSAQLYKIRLKAQSYLLTVPALDELSEK